MAGYHVKHDVEPLVERAEHRDRCREHGGLSIGSEFEVFFGTLEAEL